jgi:hypothetical protein
VVKKLKTLDDKPSRADNADDRGGLSMGGDFVEGSNNTNSAIDSFTHKEGEEPGPSDELERNPAASSEPVGFLFWVCHIIFVMMHIMLTVGTLDGITLVCLTFSDT